jgi:hypothetical protein
VLERNQVRSTSSSKSKKKFALLTYTTNNIIGYSAYSLAINSAYAEYRGYGMQVLTPHDGAEYEPGDQRWNKVKILLDAIGGGDVANNTPPSWMYSTGAAVGDETEYVVWMDADLIMLDFAFQLEAVVAQYPDADLLLSSDPYPEEIFSVVNTGFIIVKRRSARARAFLREWWAGDTSSSSRLRGWDQHRFTTLYTSGRGTIEECKNISTFWYKDAIAVLPPAALNTHRPATQHQQPGDPVLHMIGSVMHHRYSVFALGLNSLCTAHNNGNNGNNNDDAIPLQLGLTKEKLVDIERQVLGRRGGLASALEQGLTTLLSGVRSSDSGFDSAAIYPRLQGYKADLDEIMKLGDPRQGDPAEVRCVATCLSLMLDIASASASSSAAAVAKASDHNNVIAEAASVLEWGIDAGFELSLSQSAPEVLVMMEERMAPLTQSLLALITASSAGVGSRKEEAAAKYFEFKRRQFSAISLMENVGDPTEHSEALYRAQAALEAAVEAWRGLKTAASSGDIGARSSSGKGVTGSQAQEGAQVLERLGLLLCGSGQRHEDGMALTREALGLLWGVWDDAAGATVAGDDTSTSTVSSTPGGTEEAVLKLIPPSARSGLVSTYYNLAICVESHAQTLALQGAAVGKSKNKDVEQQLELSREALRLMLLAGRVLASNRPGPNPRGDEEKEEEDEWAAMTEALNGRVAFLKDKTQQLAAVAAATPAADGGEGRPTVTRKKMKKKKAVDSGGEL